MDVTVVPHDPRWRQAYESEANAIQEALVVLPLTLHHIGSTAIPGILAKPIIDMLAVVDDLDALDRRNASLEALGYAPKGAFGIDGRRYFQKIDAAGRRTHHIHAFERGSPQVERHLAFRDYLCANPDMATAYSDLKARLTAAGPVPRDVYMDGKAPFIAATEAAALNWYRRSR